MKLISLIFLWLSVFSTQVHADERFFSSSSRGWHWYEEKKNEEEKERAEEKLSPGEKTKRFQKELENKLQKALWNPSEKNIKDYIIHQEKLLEMSHVFANNWQKVLFRNPELDYSNQHPVNQSALHVYHANNKEKVNKKIKALSESYGLIYFYRSNCPYCKKFSSVVKDFADRHNWKVLGVSLDGAKVPEFPDSKVNNGIAEALNIKVVPALIAVHPKDNTHIPISYGYVSQQEIENRIDLLVGGKP
jgi:conjugal transfer pilus assembly protein TraF